MKTTTHMIHTLALALALLGSDPAAASVVAKIGSREVTADEVRPYLDALPPADRAALLENKAELGRFVRAILVRQAVLADATGAGWDKKPETIAGLQRVRDQFVVESYLAEVGKVPDNYPSEEETKALYDAEKDRLQVPQRYELSQIFLASDGDAAAARKRAGELAATLRDEPGEFAALAKRNSNDAASASRGGKLGWLTAETITPEIRAVVAKMKKGEISGPVEGRAGFHIVKVDDIRPAGTASYDEVKAELSALLRQRRAELNRESHLAGLLERQAVSVNELALDSLK
jgi:peptidylprolyl isomerase